MVGPLRCLAAFSALQAPAGLHRTLITLCFAFVLCVRIGQPLILLAWRPRSGSVRLIGEPPAGDRRQPVCFGASASTLRS